MTWTYDGQPETLPRDAVRLLVGDTDDADQLAQDADIAFALAENDGNVYFAAADVADMLSARFTRSVDLNVEGLGAQFARRAVAFAELAARLRQMGRSRRGKKLRPLVDPQFTDHKPIFDVGMHDFHRQPHQEVAD